MHRHAPARLVPVAAAALCALLWSVAAVSSVAAHVNRFVGPYSIVVFLVEEPVYADNHAGFEFWVRKGEVPVLGLEQTIKAVATGHGEQLDLTVPPIDGTGFYVLDHTTDGVAFDPQGGGAWTLELSGSIDGTPVDATFPVTFPSYPRIGDAAQGSAASPAATPTAPSAASMPVWLLVVAAVIAAGVAAVALVGRRGRGVAGAP